MGIAAPGRSKGRRGDRLREAPLLLGAAGALAVDLADSLRATIGDGFGDDRTGDDRFDAAVGLFGLINVLRGRRPPGDPRDPVLGTVEGWILGQAASHGPGLTGAWPAFLTTVMVCAARS